ncbi:unnamed protein product [Moneuplotes crassus]|uniref:C2H2-type domain-containing protein n=1 Tax=Euplotes crassus TaxID=5936 RepID=A0AAD1U545_EUPCR|nr:unnamed protein product [Moneuplotes crassus]
MIFKYTNKQLEGQSALTKILVVPSKPEPISQSLNSLVQTLRADKQGFQPWGAKRELQQDIKTEKSGGDVGKYKDTMISLHTQDKFLQRKTNEAKIDRSHYFHLRNQQSNRFQPISLCVNNAHPTFPSPSTSQTSEISERRSFARSHPENSCDVKNAKKKTCVYEYCTCGLSKDDAYLVNYLLKKNNLQHMAELKNFKYELIQKETKVNKKRYFEFICKFNGTCNTKYRRSWNFLDHCRSHYGIRPYQCDECDRSFTQKGNLKKHKLTHRR